MSLLHCDAYTYILHTQLFPVSRNTECQSTDIELNYTYSSVDKPGAVTLDQHGAKGLTLSPYHHEDAGIYSNPNESNIDEATEMSYTYASIDKPSKKTDDLPKKSLLTDEDEKKHCDKPDSLEEVTVTDDYTYAEVNKKPKPSLDTDKSTEATTSEASGVNTQDDEFSYLYSSVDKKKPQMD